MICESRRESVASMASDMLIYNRPYIILVATGDRAYVNLHPCLILTFFSAKMEAMKEQVGDTSHTPELESQGIVIHLYRYYYTW